MSDRMAYKSSAGLRTACEKSLFALILSAALLPLTANAQGRPDIVWIAGGHGWEVRSVAFSPDGQMLASGSGDDTIKLWNVADGSLIRTLTGHGFGVRSVAFSPDSQMLASGSGDRTIKLWNVADGTLIRTLTGHYSTVCSVAFSPDGQMLASGSGSFDRTIKLWNVSDGAVLQTYDQETGAGVLSIQFSPDGRLFGYGRVDATVVVARNPFAFQRGDTNCDGSIDLTDVGPFITALLDPDEYENKYPDCDIDNADINADGSVDLVDVEPFIELLLGP